MKVSQAVDFHLQYHRANSKKNTIKTCELVLSRFMAQFGKRDFDLVLIPKLFKHFHQLNWEGENDGAVLLHGDLGKRL